MIRLFVYGTLMKNCCNHKLYLSGQRYLGQAVLPGYALYNLGSYPGVVPDRDEKVLGELYEIDPSILEELDIFEDNGDLYMRRKAKVLWHDAVLDAEVYVWNGPVCARDRICFDDQPWKDDFAVR